MSNNNKKDIGFLEGLKIIFVVITTFAIPTVPITYLLTNLAGLNIYLSVFIGLVVTIGIVKVLGWDRPAYENENKGETDEDEED